MSHATYSFILVLIMAVVTTLLRFLPFLLFTENTPKPVSYLGEVLPYAIIAMLVVYCLRGTQFLRGNHGIPEIISVILVVVLHKWKHNVLLSILCGTICYMLLVQNLNIM